MRCDSFSLLCRGSSAKRSSPVDICSLTNALATALVADIADVCHASMWLTRVKMVAWRGSFALAARTYVIPSPPKGQEQLPFGSSRSPQVDLRQVRCDALG